MRTNSHSQSPHYSDYTQYCAWKIHICNLVLDAGKLIRPNRFASHKFAFAGTRKFTIARPVTRWCAILLTTLYKNLLCVRWRGCPSFNSNNQSLLDRGSYKKRHCAGIARHNADLYKTRYLYKEQDSAAIASAASICNFGRRQLFTTSLFSFTTVRQYTAVLTGRSTSDEESTTVWNGACSTSYYLLISKRDYCN